MSLRGMADAGQLTALTTLLDEYSEEADIVGNDAAREKLSICIMRLFNDGLTKPEDIRRNLDLSPSRWMIDKSPERSNAFRAKSRPIKGLVSETRDSSAAQEQPGQ